MDKISEMEEYKNVSGGLVYFQCFYKIVEVVESRAKLLLQPLEFTNPKLVYAQWLIYFLSGDLRNSETILQANLDLISELLIADLQKYAKEYDEQQNKTKTKIPKIFNPGEIGKFADDLVSKNAEFMSSSTIYQILTYKSLALWNSGHFSGSLAQMAAIWEFFDANMEDNVELGSHVIFTFSTMLRQIAEKNLAPAINFLDVLMEKLRSKVPLLQFMVFIQYKANPGLEAKSQEILRNYPSIQKLMGQFPKFEKALLNPSIIEDNFFYFIKDLLINLDYKQFVVKEKLGKISGKTLQEMVDIQILELLQSQDFEEAVQLIESSCKKGLPPSMETIKALLSNNSKCYNTGIFL